MKKTFTYFIAIVASLSIFSCQKFESETVKEDETVVINFIGTFGETLKSTMGANGITPEWVEGDQITVYPSVSGNSSIAKAEDSGKTVTFSMTVKQKQAANFTSCYAFYPANSAKSSSSFDIPNQQNGKFGAANISVAVGAYSATRGGGSGNPDVSIYPIFNFSNATALLKFAQPATGNKIKSIEITAANNICGTETVVFGDDNEISSLTLDAATAFKVITASGLSEVPDIYIAVAPVATGSLSFVFTYGDDGTRTVKVDGGKTLERNKIYDMGQIPAEVN